MMANRLLAAKGFVYVANPPNSHIAVNLCLSTSVACDLLRSYNEANQTIWGSSHLFNEWVQSNLAPQ